jgi:hypothetical protein
MVGITPLGWISFTLGWGGGSINSVKRSKSAGSPSASFDRVYTSSSSPQCERNPPQGGNSYDQTILRSKTSNLFELNTSRNLQQGSHSINHNTKPTPVQAQTKLFAKLNSQLNPKQGSYSNKYYTASENLGPGPVNEPFFVLPLLNEYRHRVWEPWSGPGSGPCKGCFFLFLLISTLLFFFIFININIIVWTL